MKKVLVFGMTDNPGGIETMIMNYYRNINKKEIQFDFLCNTSVVAYENEIKSLGGNIIRITARSKNRKKFKSELNYFFKNNSKDYIAIWVNVCSLANIDYLKYAKKYGIKKRIIHSHNSMNMDSMLRGLLHKFNKLFISKFATDFWACGELAANWFYNKKIINSNKFKIINNAIDVNKYRFDKKIRDEYRKKFNLNDKIVMGNVGRLHFQKNQVFLLDIFNEFQKKEKNSILLLVGDGEERKKLEEKVRQLKLTKKVKFLGIRDDVDRIMQSMDLFVFPSVFEGLPLVLIEAQASGLPIFVSDSVTKEVKFSDNMYYISLNNSPNKWVEKINGCNLKRVNNIKEISRNGFNIKNESKIIQSYFEGSK